MSVFFLFLSAFFQNEHHKHVLALVTQSRLTLKDEEAGAGRGAGQQRQTLSRKQVGQGGARSRMGDEGERPLFQGRYSRWRVRQGCGEGVVVRGGGGMDSLLAEEKQKKTPRGGFKVTYHSLPLKGRHRPFI